MKAYPKAFWLLCLACLFFFSSFTMVIPDMPLVLEKLGGREYIWLIIPSFASIALIMRPLSGKMTDVNGRVFVMVLGAVITTLSGVLYFIVPFVSLLFAVRAFHGISAGFTPTGFTAYADDIVPLHKRGEAMGIIGICNNIGNAMGWVLGSQVTQSFGIETMFYVSSSLGLISVVMFSFLKESIHNKQKLNINLLKFNRHDLIETRVIFPSLIFLLVCFTSGSILALIGDFSAYLKIENKGLYMAVYISASLFIRFMAGRWSDKYGRQKIAIIGCVLLFLSMLSLANAIDIKLYLISSVLFGAAFGLLSPSIFAWAVDIALPGLKGKAVGTLFIFMELGIIIGSGVSGLLYNNNANNFSLIFIACGIIALVPLSLIYYRKYILKRI